MTGQVFASMEEALKYCHGHHRLVCKECGFHVSSCRCINENEMFVDKCETHLDYTEKYENSCALDDYFKNHWKEVREKRK